MMKRIKSARKGRFFNAKRRRKGMMIMKKYDWKQWAKAAGVRAVKTVAQTAVATIGTAAIMSEVNWAMILSASILSGVISLLTSVAGLPELNVQE